MNAIDVQQVLSQIRTLQAQASNRPAPAADAAAGTAASAASGAAGGFGALLKTSLDKVNISQGAADKLQNAFERGDPSADLASVMLATSKAQVSFKAVVEVRNRLVSAYQDIMNMPL